MVYFLDPNRELCSMKQSSSKQKSSNKTLKSFSEKQFSYTERLNLIYPQKEVLNVI